MGSHKDETSSALELPARLPTFDEMLPYDKLPHGCAWGIWDRPGEKDEFGTLNLLTPDIIAAAAAGINHGISVSLKLGESYFWHALQLTIGSWSLDKPELPVFQRSELKHNIIDNATKGSPNSFDDTVCFNTQSGSQWDGLRHVVHHRTGMFYNGFSHKQVMANPYHTLGINSKTPWLTSWLTQYKRRGC